MDKVYSLLLIKFRFFVIVVKIFESVSCSGLSRFERFFHLKQVFEEGNKDYFSVH